MTVYLLVTYLRRRKRDAEMADLPARIIKLVLNDEFVYDRLSTLRTRSVFKKLNVFYLNCIQFWFFFLNDVFS